MKVVLGRGFYSRENINACFKHHQKFLIVVSTRLKMVREGIAAVKDSLPIWSHYLRQYETYGIAHSFEWENGSLPDKIVIYDYFVRKERRSVTMKI